MGKTLYSQNKALIKKYPFLQYRDASTGDPIPLKELNSTHLDNISSGWRNLTLKLCDDIMNHLKEIGKIDEYRVFEVKSKFGYGRWYDYGSDDYIDNLVRQWEHDTSVTCEFCGKPATWVSDGWIAPYCDECKAEVEQDSPGVTFSKGCFGVHFTKIDG